MINGWTGQNHTGPFLGGVLTQLLPPTPELRCFDGDGGALVGLWGDVVEMGMGVS